MRILHTSDWHLGHRLHEQSQHEEQLLFLNWLVELVDNQHIDVLLMAGDLFDTAVPSTWSQKLYYDFLLSMHASNCKHVVIVGGNHDAPATLNAPKELLASLSIHVVGKASSEAADEVFELDIDGEKLIVAAAPYLRDQDIRRAVMGETFDQIGDRYKSALVTHYRHLADYCEPLKTDNSMLVATGHLFAIGGSTSDSEQTIYVGNLGDIGADDFPDCFDYIALGHLHRCQKVGKREHIRYSGAPYTLSFSERGQQKAVILLDSALGKLQSVSELPVPEFRSVCRVSGSLNECIAELQTISNKPQTLTTWVEVVLDNAIDSKSDYASVRDATEELNLEILKVSLKNRKRIYGLEQLAKHVKDIKDLSPEEVFVMKCKEQNVEIENEPELLDAFREIVQIARDA